MPYATIDREDVIDLFHQFMQRDGKMRVLRLIGSPKQGKTHFMTEVFPDIAERIYQARCVTLDLRNKGWSIVHVLQMSHDWLGGDDAFPKYYAAYSNWISRTPPSISGTRLFLSVLNFDYQREALN